MTDTMLERMAEGLYEHDRSLATLSMQELGLWCPWADVEESRRREYIRKVRAVLSVMRDPTGAMMCGCIKGAAQMMKSVWRDMIDAIEQEGRNV